ncbi:transcription factor [Fusarium longipes]|uniref:Transcription factor n=1 Tax=Fusarium longipes TaxID=694270 RepID=A0A395SYB0_9HYPO|nr:transcription factor [Fusarium longipes]
MSYSLTQQLLASDEQGYKRATQSEFLRLAGHGKASKDLLGLWLANDRLYIHSYCRGLGRLLSFLEYPDTVQRDVDAGPTTQLLDWIVAALVNIRREEKFFINTAFEYGININLETKDGHVESNTKLEGLRRWEALYNSVSPNDTDVLPWLEAAVIYWGTEKCYLDAWSWAKAQLSESDGSDDADGGAVRKEFINNWTCKEFVEFVDDLGKIIDDAVAKVVEEKGEDAKEQFFKRVEEKWHAVLAAEEAFWPAV